MSIAWGCGPQGSSPSISAGVWRGAHTCDSLTDADCFASGFDVAGFRCERGTSCSNPGSDCCLERVAMVCESVRWRARVTKAIGVKTPRPYRACRPEKPAKPDQNIILSGSLTRGNP